MPVERPAYRRARLLKERRALLRETPANEFGNRLRTELQRYASRLAHTEIVAERTEHGLRAVLKFMNDPLCTAQVDIIRENGKLEAAIEYFQGNKVHDEYDNRVIQGSIKNFRKANGIPATLAIVQGIFDASYHAGFDKAKLRMLEHNQHYNAPYVPLSFAFQAMDEKTREALMKKLVDEIRLNMKGQFNTVAGKLKLKAQEGEYLVRNFS